MFLWLPSEDFAVQRVADRVRMGGHIAHWPARITRKNQLEKQPGHLMDLMAACVDLSGAAYPKDLNG